jgi:ribonuclease E
VEVAAYASAAFDTAPSVIEAEPVYQARIEPAVPAAMASPVVPVESPEPARVVTAQQAPVEKFVLPLDSLQAVAESAGLQWVNSDAEKIRAVNAEMAAEPKPVHVPRERKEPARVDEGPLVLVETRKDLTQFKLPFETAQGAQPQP